MRLLYCLALVIALAGLVSCSGKKAEEKAKAATAGTPKAQENNVPAKEPEAPVPEKAVVPEAAPAPEAEAETPEAPKAPVVNAIVAKVNGKDVDCTEHFTRLMRVSKKKRDTYDGKTLAKSTVDRLVNELLITEEIAKIGEPITDEEIAEGLGMDAIRFGQSKDKLTSRIEEEKEKIAITRLLKARGLLAEPTDEEIQREYGKRKMIRLNVVNFRVALNPAPEEETAAKTKADEFYAVVTGGKDFKEAAKELTDEKIGGRAVRAMIVRDGEPRQKEMWDAAATLEENGIGAPIRTQFGWAVFQVVKKIEPRYTFEEMKDRLKKNVMSQKSIQAKRRLIDELRKEAQIEYLVDFAEIPRPGFLGAKARASVGRISPMKVEPLRIRQGEVNPETLPKPEVPPQAAPSTPAEPAAGAR